MTPSQDWKEAAEKWEASLPRGVTITVQQIFQAGAEHGYDAGIARESLAWHKECEQLKQQAENREETNRQVSTALVHAYAEIEKLEQQLSDMTWEYENACKFATQFEQQRDKLKAEVEHYREVHGQQVDRTFQLVSEVDTLKAEVENLTAERGHCKAGWAGCKADYTQLSARMDEYLADYKKLNDASIQLRIDLERERADNAKLREALKGAREALGPSPWGSLRHEIDALLAAKQDEGK